jgi:hypothetical protein
VEQEDLKWRQQAKVEWLKNGDRNTNFFHPCVNQQRRRSNIESITDGNGRTCTTEREIEGAFVDYFQNLFTSSNPRNHEECIVGLEGRVTSSMNNMLMAELSRSKMKRALDQMDPMKAPGPDGFTTEFYQQNWETVGTEVCATIIKFFNGAKMEKSVNFTNIVLIPKSKHPSTISEFRLISLCTVFYKLISKVLVNRIKNVLPHIISYNQSVFIPGRFISDNILVAYKTLHTMHTRMWSKVGYMGIKLDMSKAFDRVEWSFPKAGDD